MSQKNMIRILGKGDVPESKSIILSHRCVAFFVFFADYIGRFRIRGREFLLIFL